MSTWKQPIGMYSLLSTLLKRKEFALLHRDPPAAPSERVVASSFFAFHWAHVLVRQEEDDSTLPITDLSYGHARDVLAVIGLDGLAAFNAMARVDLE